MGNITGAMVFQASIPTVVALVFAPAAWVGRTGHATSAFASAGDRLRCRARRSSSRWPGRPPARPRPAGRRPVLPRLPGLVVAIVVLSVEGRPRVAGRSPGGGPRILGPGLDVTPRSTPRSPGAAVACLPRRHRARPRRPPRRRRAAPDLTISICYFEGAFVPMREAKVSIMTHAFMYGTAVFEGIRAYWNEEQGSSTGCSSASTWSGSAKRRHPAHGRPADGRRARRARRGDGRPQRPPPGPLHPAVVLQVAPGRSASGSTTSSTSCTSSPSRSGTTSTWTRASAS